MTATDLMVYGAVTTLVSLVVPSLWYLVKMSDPKQQSADVGAKAVIAAVLLNVAVSLLLALAVQRGCENADRAVAASDTSTIPPLGD